MKTHPSFPSAAPLLCLFLLAVCAIAEIGPPVPNVPPKRGRAIQVWWDASPTPGASYVLRRGVAPGRYDEMVFIPAGTNVLTLTYIWTNAPAAATNYFIVSAKVSGITNGVPWEEESLPSNEVGSLPRDLPVAPALRAAVPITVEIYRVQPGQAWVKVLDVGPFYDSADLRTDNYSSIVKIGPAVKMLPE